MDDSSSHPDQGKGTTPHAPETTTTPSRSEPSNVRSIGEVIESAGLQPSAAPKFTPEQHEAYLKERRRDEYLARCEESWTWLTRNRPRRAGCRLSTFEISRDQAIGEKQRRVIARLEELSKIVQERPGEIPNLVIFGPVGSGKDHLMASMLRVAVMRGLKPQWQRGLDIATQFRAAMGRDPDLTEGQLIERYAETALLAISDLLPPAGPLTAFQAECLYQIIDRRYETRRPTWVTLNVANREEAISRMGEQLADRLRDETIMAHCNWPSYRKPWGEDQKPRKG